MQPGVTLDKRSLEGVGSYLGRVDDILRRNVEFGNPAHPYDPASTDLAGDVTAGDGAHNGALDNIYGSWVEVEVEELDAAVTCNHNLDVTPIAGEPNIRVLQFLYQHNGALRNIIEDLRGPASAGSLEPGIANPVWVPGFAGSPTLQYLSMSGTRVPPTPAGSVYYYFQLPHSYVQGSPISPHVHWCKINANPGVPYWEFEYTNASPVAAAPEVFPAPLITGNAAPTIGGNPVAWEHSVTALPPIVVGVPPTGPPIVSEVLVCRISRDQNNVLDTYFGAGNDVAFLEMDLHFFVDSNGSDGEYIKTDPWGMEEGSVSVGYDPADSGAITNNSIDLRFFSPWRLVDNSNPLKATLFFIPAVRG